MGTNNILNIEKQINYYTKDLPNNNYLLGKGAAMPFNPTNSGSRKLMFSTMREQSVALDKAEVPLIQTGHENEFGRHSSSFVQSEKNYKVLYKINKFSFVNNHYYLIVQDIDSGIYDVIERLEYNHNTESYGYLFNNTYLDSLKPGSIINKGDVIKKSIGFDTFNNKMDGVNLTTLYLSCSQNMEDSCIISESAAKKLSTTLVKTTSIVINDNDILLNLYGDEKRYKTFPDVGEEINGGIFCAVRRLENDTMLYSLSQNRLRDIMMSDKKTIMNGRVVDIDVICNNPEVLSESVYNQQLYFYYTEKLKFCKTIYDLVSPLALNGILTKELNTLYSICRDTINGKQFSNNKVFNNALLEITVLEPLPMQPGDKICDRYGGKGVVSEIRKDEFMPRLSNGEVADIIKNQSTCINRENLGQLFEQSLTFISSRIIDFFKSGTLSYREMIKIWYDFVVELEPSQAEYIMSYLNNNDEFEMKWFINSIIEDNGIIVSIEPFTCNMTIDKLNTIYKKFPWIKPYDVTIPMEDSNGNVRYIETRKPLVVGKIYNYRLKQYAEEKFSATSLSATNLKNLNTRSKASKMYETKYKKTPIMFGAMESGNMAHLQMHYVVMNLMIYSSSPQGRRLFEQLLIGDPYDINIKLDRNAKNRNAEIINVLLKTIGLKLVFSKVPKSKNYFVNSIVAKVVRNQDFKYKTNIRDIIGHDDELQMKYNAAMNDTKSKDLCSVIIAKKRNDLNG